MDNINKLFKTVYMENYELSNDSYWESYKNEMMKVSIRRNAPFTL